MKMLVSLTALVVLTSAFVAGQRPFFAGSRPIGFPETPNVTTTEDTLGNRFGEGTTQRLPAEANGDRELIDRLSKLPVENQPFWFINWQALEAHRQKPQTYPQRPSVFVDPVASSTTGIRNRFSTTNPGNTLVNRFAPTTNSNQANQNSNSNSPGLENKNGSAQTTDPKSQNVERTDKNYNTKSDTNPTKPGHEYF